MGEKDLKDAFKDLEKAVDRLLSSRKAPTGGGLKSEAVLKPASGADKDAIELIRKAIERLKALY